jgi:tRNA uracil 4-sulfurtransferase
VNQQPKKIYIRYDEVALKRGSRAHFEKKLKKNIARICGITRGQITRIRGRMVINVPEDRASEECLRRLKKCFGIARFNPVSVVPSKIENIFAKAVELAQSEFAAGKRSFKIEARRSDKNFAMKSPEINAEAGGIVLDTVPGLTVNVHKPDFVLRIEVFAQDCYLYSQDLKGPGGLPTGVGGKALLLLSGGIDSPVAGWLTQKRGLHVDAIYFHSFPFTGEKTKEKVKDLAAIIGESSPDPIRLHVCAVTDIQKVLKEHVPSAYWTIMLRRFMVRISDKLAEKFKYRALVTGDALGQVASQTLENLNCLEGVSKRLVLRPLIGYDKNEVIQVAREIGTYETSILPFQDCCTLFAPSHPITRGRRFVCEQMEEALDVDGLVNESLEGMELYKHLKKEGMIRVEQGGKGILENTIPAQSESCVGEASPTPEAETSTQVANETVNNLSEPND